MPYPLAKLFAFARPVEVGGEVHSVRHIPSAGNFRVTADLDCTFVVRANLVVQPEWALVFKIDPENSKKLLVGELS